MLGCKFIAFVDNTFFNICYGSHQIESHFNFNQDLCTKTSHNNIIYNNESTNKLNILY